MNTIRKAFLPVLLATTWISISEFIRNEYLLKSFWTDHYQSLGLVFPSDPLNGAVWGLWSLLFAIVVFILSKKYTLVQTTFLAWFTGFVLMWVVVANMGVLPVRLLIYAVPLSILESFLASVIVFRLQKK